jgi:DivIVA domain-containing protein
MNDNTDLLPNLSHDDVFEVQLRGYSRRQVDEFLARCRSQIRELEQRLARALDEGEGLRHDLATARQQALGAKPAHQEVSERIAQILKLADDEARSEKAKANDEIAQMRTEAQGEVDRLRTEAREQAERMLTAAQEQAERAITTARAEAEKNRAAARTEAERMTTMARTEAERTTSTARAEAERTTTEAQKKADNALSSAKAQAKKALDEATARATAIHDGAERRLNLLSMRHSETVKRLSDILEGVSTLVAAEAARPSLEDEVAQATAKTIANAEANGVPISGPTGPGTQAPGQPRPQPTAHQQAPAPQAQSQQAQSQQAHSVQPQQAQPKRTSGSTRTIDEDEQTEGIRIMPTS